jgi:recombinational DNA repair protein (RecF pathway)
MGKEQYDAIFTLIKHMLRSDNQEYFNWLARILLKIFVVKFLAEAGREIKETP